MNRRVFLGLLAAPAIIRVADLMPIRRVVAKSPALVAPYKGMVQFVGNPIVGDDPYKIYVELCREYARNCGLGIQLLTGDNHAQYEFYGPGGTPWSRSLGRQCSDEKFLRSLGLAAHEA